jgi:hypothetical protein
MKIFKYIIFVTILYPSFLFSADQSFVDSVLKKYNVAENEVLLIFFLDIGSCMKCYMLPKNIVNKLEKQTDKKIITIAYVACNREKEIKNFAVRIGWHYFTEPDIERVSRNKFGGSESTSFLIINSKGEVIIDIQDTDNLKDIISRLLIVINKLE